MTNILVVAELLDGKIRKSTHSAITFARQTGSPFSILVAGAGARDAATEVTRAREVLTGAFVNLSAVAGYIGAALIGLAVGLTVVPLAWLTVYGRHKQIAYRGDWLRAARRATWVGIVVTTLIAMRLEGLLELPLVLFIVAIAFVAEATLSAERWGRRADERADAAGAAWPARADPLRRTLA